MTFVLIRYVHFLGIILLASTLFTEHIMLKKVMIPAEMKKLAVVDLIYGISAILVLASGLTLWFAVGKPATFYNSNPIFHTKITLFLVVGVMSIYPTMFILKSRKSKAETIAVPKKIIMMLRIEILLLLIIPLLAVLMAQGYGMK